MHRLTNQSKLFRFHLPHLTSQLHACCTAQNFVSRKDGCFNPAVPPNCLQPCQPDEKSTVFNQAKDHFPQQVILRTDDDLKLSLYRLKSSPVVLCVRKSQTAVCRTSWTVIWPIKPWSREEIATQHHKYMRCALRGRAKCCPSPQTQQVGWNRDVIHVEFLLATSIIGEKVLVCQKSLYTLKKPQWTSP